MRFATADYSFPLLSWEKALRLARDLEMDGIDLSLFQDRSQIKPEEALANPSVSGARTRAAVEGPWAGGRGRFRHTRQRLH